MLKLTLVAALALAAPSAFAAYDVPAINAYLADSLRQLQEPNTQATFAIDQLDANSERINSGSAHGSFAKTLTTGSSELVLDKISYNNPVGGPTVVAGNGHVTTKLSAILPTFTWNILVPQMESLLNIGFRQFARPYGNSVSFKVKVKNIGKDARGNYNSFLAEANFKIDLAKLPAGVDPGTVMATEGSLTVDAKLNEGMVFQFSLTANPAANGWYSKKESLKDVLDGLQARDSKSPERILAFYKYLDKKLSALGMGNIDQ
jgi:hypothetical protein